MAKSISASTKKSTKPTPIRVGAENDTEVQATESKSLYAVKSGIPVPARTRPGGFGGASPYPFKEMQPEDSFFVPVDVNEDEYNSPEEAQKARLEQARTVANRLTGATRRFTKGNPKYTFAVRTVKNGSEMGFDSDFGVGVWRNA